MEEATSILAEAIFVALLALIGGGPKAVRVIRQSRRLGDRYEGEDEVEHPAPENEPLIDPTIGDLLHYITHTVAPLEELTIDALLDGRKYRLTLTGDKNDGSDEAPDNRRETKAEASEKG